jgi:hypothetical protein
MSEFIILLLLLLLLYFFLSASHNIYLINFAEVTILKTYVVFVIVLTLSSPVMLCDIILLILSFIYYKV